MFLKYKTTKLDSMMRRTEIKELKLVKIYLDKSPILFELLKIDNMLKTPRYWISNNELLLYHLMCFHYIKAEKVNY